MQITHPYGYTQCISIAAQLDQISKMIDGMDSVDEEFLSDREYDVYIVETSASICELADIMRSKARSYTVDDDEPDVETVKR